MMRFTIRLLTIGTLALFVVALWVADHGKRAQATSTPNTMRYAGLAEFLILWGLLALTLLVFLILSAIGVALAVKQRDRAWGIGIAVIVIGIGAVYVGSFVPPGVLLPVVRLVLPSSTFQALPLTLLPALLGGVCVAGYSFRTLPAPRPPHSRRVDD